jgi:hypothetical protein
MVNVPDYTPEKPYTEDGRLAKAEYIHMLVQAWKELRKTV